MRWPEITSRGGSSPPGRSDAVEVLVELVKALAGWHWVRRRWWAYLLVGCRDWNHFWCRARGHPYPVYWFNPGGDEPDMRCRNCQEDLG